MQISIPITICLAGYGLLMLAVSLFWMTRVKKAVDFLMGGRKLPFWVLTGTFTATGEQASRSERQGSLTVAVGPGASIRSAWGSESSSSVCFSRRCAVTTS